MQRAALKTRAAFWLRVRFRRHGPRRTLDEVLAGGFTYGRYGGLGHGVTAGEYRTPVDALDRLYLAHDLAYATPEEFERYADARAGVFEGTRERELP